MTTNPPTNLLSMTPKDDLVLYGLKLAMADHINNITDSTLLFRADSCATKYWSNFCHVYGAEYIKAILKKPLKRIEKDKNINTLVNITIDSIIQTPVPPIITNVLQYVYTTIKAKGWDPLISIKGLHFLRFICPAIATPQLWGYTINSDNQNTHIDISSAIQTATKNTTFEPSSPRAIINHTLVDRNLEMHQYIWNLITNIPDNISNWDWDHVQMWLCKLSLNKYHTKFMHLNGQGLYVAVFNEFRGMDINPPDTQTMISSLESWPKSPRNKEPKIGTLQKSTTLPNITRVSKPKTRPKSLGFL